MKRYRAVIFDWDGTVMDSVARIVSSMQQAAILSCITPPTAEAVSRIIGMSLDKGIERLFPHGMSAAVLAQVEAHYRAQYRQDNPTPTPLFDGIEKLLNALYDNGYKLAVATGKSRAGIQRALTDTGLGHYFSALRCGDECQSKPHPEMLHQLMQELDVAADEMVMIGDSVHDMAMAQAAGVDAIGVTWGVDNIERLQQSAPLAVIPSVVALSKALMA